MPDATPAERRLSARAAVLTRWARTADRSAATAAARTAFDERFEPDDPNGTLTSEQRAAMADAARRAHFADLSRRAAKARRLAMESRLAEAEERRVQRAATRTGATS